MRIAHYDRIELQREHFTVTVAGEPVRIKVGKLDGKVVNLAPEHADCERAARISGEPVKVVWAQGDRGGARMIEQRIRAARQRRRRLLRRRRLERRRRARPPAPSATGRSR